MTGVEAAGHPGGSDSVALPPSPTLAFLKAGIGATPPGQRMLHGQQWVCPMLLPELVGSGDGVPHPCKQPPSVQPSRHVSAVSIRSARNLNACKDWQESPVQSGQGLGDRIFQRCQDARLKTARLVSSNVLHAHTVSGNRRHSLRTLLHNILWDNIPMMLLEPAQPPQRHGN
jgi:hypothetical protein